jgi:hypothetical protein
LAALRLFARKAPKRREQGFFGGMPGPGHHRDTASTAEEAPKDASFACFLTVVLLAVGQFVQLLAAPLP